MSDNEGARKTQAAIVVSTTPDVCKVTDAQNSVTSKAIHQDLRRRDPYLGSTNAPR